MKNFYILLLITVILLSGCSKASQTGSAVEAAGVATAATSQSADTGVYAYIPYWSGRIDSYSVADGKLTKTGNAKVGRIVCLAAHPSGEYLYAVDNKEIFTRFTVGSDGQLADPVEFKPDIKNRYVNQLAVHPNGKFMFVGTTAGNLDGEVTGAVVVLSIGTDGRLSQTSFKIETPHGIAAMGLTPSGEYLFVRSRGRVRTYKVEANGSLAESASNTGIAESSTDLAFSSDGKQMLLGQDGDYSAMILCGIDGGKLKKLNEARVPAVVSPSMVTYSIATDQYGNVLTVNGNNWLTMYKVTGTQINLVDSFVNYRDHQWTTLAQAEAKIPTTPEYTKRLQSAVAGIVDKEKDALYGALFDHTSYIAAVAVGPDGLFYVSTSSGVYRFKSSAEGAVYEGAAITWSDNTDIFLGINQASPQQKYEAKPVQDGLVFVKKK